MDRTKQDKKADASERCDETTPTWAQEADDRLHVLSDYIRGLAGYLYAHGFRIPADVANAMSPQVTLPKADGPFPKET